MAIQALDYRRHVRRPIGFVVLGFLLLAASGYVFYDVWVHRTNVQPLPAAYTYTVSQSVDKTVSYFPSSYYGDGPGTNTAFIMGLTDKLKATFHYKFSASEVQTLSYAYDIRAMVEGLFSLDGNETNTANVWSKSFPLMTPVHGTVTAKDLSFDPSIDVPYNDYTKLIEELRTSLVLPISSKVTVLFTINVTGTVGGTNFNDLRTASVTAPIGLQIYTLGQKYDKQDTKQVVPVATQTGNDRRDQYESYGAIALGVLALLSLTYGFRRHIFKTPYQRELDKIYRYHDGIIVRASRPADFTGKTVVPVRSFDDMLNLEEELKAPIVSTPAGGEATRFVIIHGDIAYVFTLGKLSERREIPLEQIEETLLHKHAATAAKPKTPQKIQ